MSYWFSQFDFSWVWVLTAALCFKQSKVCESINCLRWEENIKVGSFSRTVFDRSFYLWSRQNPNELLLEIVESTVYYSIVLKKIFPWHLSRALCLFSGCFIVRICWMNVSFVLPLRNVKKFTGSGSGSFRKIWRLIFNFSFPWVGAAPSVWVWLVPWIMVVKCFLEPCRMRRVASDYVWGFWVQLCTFCISYPVVSSSLTPAVGKRI